MSVTTEVEPEEVARLFEVFPRLLRAIATTAFKHGEDPAFRSLTQLHVVKHLAERPWLVSELAQEMRLSAPTVSVAVESLVRRGLVQRGEASDDRRANPLTLTAEGERCYQDARERVIDALGGILEQVPSEDRTAFVQGVNAVARVLDVHSSATEASASHSDLDSKELAS